jgi:hypothetical protein
MDERLKILLGSEDIVTRDNEDLYININLNRSFYEYKKEVYDNDFDLAQQFDKERNSSRNFRIYGIIDSNVIDTSNINMRVYSDSGTTNLITSTTTTPMNFNGSINVFNKRRGKYYISLNNYSGTSVFIKIPSNNDNINEQIFEQKLVFFDFDNEFVPYGTETVEIDNNLNTIEINNNFPFFYNKHWVKKNISLQETKYPVVNFSGTSETIFEGQLTNIVVYLDKPSPFGNEKVDFVFDSGTADLFDFLVYSNNPSSPFPGTVQLEFAQGEQYKNLFFSASTDDIVEVLENYKFRLDNFIKVKSGNLLNYVVEIQNSTPRKYANFELTNLYENRAPHVGLSALTTSPGILYPTPSILRNGLFYNNFQNEFYPLDEVVVDITNFSTNTVLLPQNSGLGNSQDELWLAGLQKTFTIRPSYSTSVINTVDIYLPPSLNNAVITTIGSIANIQPSTNYVIENISINGFRMQYNPGDFPGLTATPANQSAPYEALKALLGGGSLDIYSVKDIYKPFTIIADDANFVIRLIAKSPGTRLDVDTNVTNVSDLSTIATATTTTAYTYPQQEPFRFTLLGNENNGSIANYQFRFRKPGYKNLDITSFALASEIGQANYLVTSLNNVLHNWDTPNNLPIAFSGNPMQGNFLNNRYFLPKSDAFYQGLLLLNDFDLSNPSAYNLTDYGASAFSVQSSPTEPITFDDGRWFQSPINVIARTSGQTSTDSVSQTMLLKINTQLSTSQPTQNFYSFKYRSGNSEPYKTFYWNGLNSAGILLNNGGGLNVSGNTLAPRTSPGLKYEIDLGGTFGSLVIPVGPISTTYPGYNSFGLASSSFYSPYHPTSPSNNNIQYQSNGNFEILLTAKSPGVPFEIKDIVNNNPNSEIVLMPILYNELDGITSNPYVNKMGGFSLVSP